MTRYFLARLGQAFVSILGVATIVFFVTRLTGDPVNVMMPIGATPADFERMRQHLGIDQPLGIQYINYLRNLVQGDFGVSSLYPGQDSLAVALRRLPTTLLLGASALVWAVALGVPLGITTGVRKGTITDRCAQFAAAIGQAMPAFWVGILLLWIVGVRLNWLPTSGRGDWRHFVLPSIAMGLYSFAAIVRLTRSATLEVLDKPYMLLLESKGLGRRRIILQHVLKNALAVPLTYFGIMIGILLTGSVVVETVFSWPGLGRLAVDAVLARDFATTQAVVMIMAVVYVSVNTSIDLLYGVLDPRIRDSRRS